MIDNAFYTVKDAAEVLGLSEYTVRKKIREGEIKAVQGSSDRDGYKIPHDELVAYIQKAKRAGLAGMVSGVGVGITAGIAMPVIAAATTMAVTAPAFLTGMSAGIADISKTVMDILNDETNGGVNNEKVLELVIGTLEDEIEILKCEIKALQLGSTAFSEGSDKPEGYSSLDNQKKKLACQMRIKLLERQIKAIKLRYELQKGGRGIGVTQNALQTLPLVERSPMPEGERLEIGSPPGGV